MNVFNSRKDLRVSSNGPMGAHAATELSILLKTITFPKLVSMNQGEQGVWALIGNYHLRRGPD